MKKSLTINATRNGKKVSKSLGFVNPEVANSLVGGFAQMVNALTTDTFVNAEVVKKMDTSEEEQQSGGGSTPAPAAKTTPTLTLGGWSASDTVYSAAITYNGDGNLSTSTGTISNGTLTVNDADGNFSGTVSAAEGTNYAPASLVFNYNSSSTPAPAGKTEGVITCDNNFVSTDDVIIDEITATANVSYNAEGVITCDNNFVSTDDVSTNEITATVNVSYNGDGTLKGFTAPWDLDEASSLYDPITIEGGVATLKCQFNGAGDKYFVGMFYAQATDNYTAAVCPFRVVR